MLALLLAGAPAAHAGDLLVLDSEQATISGDQNYGFVYVDGELRLTGDTTITAGSIYLGPNAGAAHVLRRGRRATAAAPPGAR